MCPYCHIGKIHYEKAMQQFAHADRVDFVIKAFRLSSSLPDRGKGIPVTEYLTKMAGYSENAVQKMFADIKLLAENAGAKFNLPNAIAANTLDAHRLIKLAAEKEVASKVMQELTKAYFEDALDYSDIEVLVKIGVHCGLCETEVRDMLDGERFKEEVESDIREAIALGIDTVPTFLFDRKQAIIGSASVEVFLETLNKACVQQTTQTPLSETHVRRGKSCNADGVCEI